MHSLNTEAFDSWANCALFYHSSGNQSTGVCEKPITPATPYHITAALLFMKCGQSICFAIIYLPEIYAACVGLLKKYRKKWRQVQILPENRSLRPRSSRHQFRSHAESLAEILSTMEWIQRSNTDISATVLGNDTYIPDMDELRELQSVDNDELENMKPDDEYMQSATDGHGDTLVGTAVDIDTDERQDGNGDTL